MEVKGLGGGRDGGERVGRWKGWEVEGLGGGRDRNR